MGLPERFSRTVAPARAAEDDGGIGTHTSSHTSAWTTRPGTSRASNSRSGPNGASRCADPDVLAGLVVAGRVPAALVELPVGRQIRLRRDAEQLAAVDHDGAVVEAVAVTQRRADDEHREELVGCLDQPRDRRLDGVEDGILHHEVVDRIAGEAQLGEDGDGDGIGIALPCRGEHRFGVRRPGRRSRPGSCRPRCARIRAGTRSRTGGSWPQSGRWHASGAGDAARCPGPPRTIRVSERQPCDTSRQRRAIVWSASDLKAAAECEFAWLRAIDARLGRIAAVEEPEDATLERAGRLGGEHERRVLAGYRRRFGAGVVEIPETSSANAAGLAEAVARTQEALASEAEVIYQAAFATDEFVGFADFLVRDDARIAGSCRTPSSPGARG